jgi:isopenicillin N synthase-like dioxygenase
VPGLAVALQNYAKACQQLGSTLLRHIALGLGLPEQYFLGKRAGPEVSYWVMRVINYPPLPGAAPPAEKVQAAPTAAGEGVLWGAGMGRHQLCSSNRWYQ